MITELLLAQKFGCAQRLLRKDSESEWRTSHRAKGSPGKTITAHTCVRR